MAGVVAPSAPDAATYKGLAAIFGYRNQDGQKQDTNCGQAAACTMLTYRGKMTKDVTVPNTNMTTLEASYPPDNAGGVLGTSRKQVEAIFKAYDLKVAVASGKDELKTAIQNSKPVVVMTSVTFQSLPVFRSPGVTVFGKTIIPSISTPKEIPTAHWMVAYGYDNNNIYLTNYLSHNGLMTWEDFLSRWGTIIGKAIDMQNKGLVASNT